jgi:hypothetical protein
MTRPESRLPDSEKWPDLFDEQALESLDRRIRRGRLTKRRVESASPPVDEEANNPRPGSAPDAPSRQAD